jgi:hypothetical protein
MLGPMRLADRFNEIERELPRGWAEATFVLEVEDDGRADRAAALLGPANPGRRGKTIRFAATRGGTGVGPEGIRRLLKRLDDEGIHGRLELVATQEAGPPPLDRRVTLRDAWERALVDLPADWSDIYAEVRLDSTDYLERGALLLSPANPLRSGPTALRFRCAHLRGYGVSAEMAGRCLLRCDEDGITGAVEVLRVLSDTDPVQTQGPVWYLGGRTI